MSEGHHIRKMSRDVRGVGLMCGMEMMADKSDRTPFDAACGVGRIADGHARKHGLITRFIGDRIAFSPPLIITEEQIEATFSAIRRALQAIG